MFENLTDDQMALVGCAVAFVATGLLMSVSHHIGRFARRNEVPNKFSYEAHAQAAEQQRAAQQQQVAAEQPVRRAA